MFVFDFQNKICVAFFLFFTKVQMKIHFNKIFLGTTLFLISKTGGLVYFHYAKCAHFAILAHLKSGLIRWVVFGGNDFIGGVLLYLVPVHESGFITL
jgi:hypothetical protein